MKVRPTYEAWSIEEELMKCTHGKSEISKESFNGLIWERIPKSYLVFFNNLEFGV